MKAECARNSREPARESDVLPPYSVTRTEPHRAFQRLDSRSPPDSQAGYPRNALRRAQFTEATHLSTRAHVRQTTTQHLRIYEQTVVPEDIGQAPAVLV